MVFQQKPFWKSWFHLLTDWSGNGSAGQFWQMERALCWLLHWVFLFVEPFITCVVCRRAEKGAKAGWKYFCFLQGDQFMFWHSFLQVGEAYVFRNLRETTMNKVWYLKSCLIIFLSLGFDWLFYCSFINLIWLHHFLWFFFYHQGNKKWTTNFGLNSAFRVSKISAGNNCKIVKKHQASSKWWRG